MSFLGYATDFIQGPMEPTSNLTAARRTPNPLEGEDEQPPEEGTVPIITEPVTTQPRTTLLGNTPTENSPIDGNLLLTTEETYSTWRQKQDAAEQLRLEAYTGNQSIHQPGQDPQIPQFGPAFEGNIPVAGRSFPTIFTGMSTPTENVERDREARDLLNIVLERQDFCGVCQTALPARAHNAEERERHYQEHRNIETEARRNALGSFATVAQGPVREVFYCEYCGKTPAEFERENNREKHGSACANKATFNDVPQYCQYCRLNFWDNDMTNETVKGHVQNCANNRRGMSNFHLPLDHN
jgi:hypothetical protein